MNSNPSITLEAQLTQRVAAWIPNLDTSERLELLAAMDPDDLRGALAFILTMYADVYDKALVANRSMLDRLVGNLK